MMDRFSDDDARLLEMVFDSTDESSDVVNDTRCKYPGKFCANARVHKLSGKLHRYCEMHRRRANVNQKRWLSQRRQALSSQNVPQQQTAGPCAPVWESMALANFCDNYSDQPNTPGSAVSPVRRQEPHTMQSPRALAGYRVLLPEPVRLDQCADPVDLSSVDAHILSTLFLSESNMQGE